MKVREGEKIIYLEEGEDLGVRCPDCNSMNFQFLPDIKHKPTKDGSFIVREWRCGDCNKMFVQTERKT